MHFMMFQIQASKFLKLRNAEELTKIKHIINNVLEIPEEDFPLDEAPVRIGKFQENKIIRGMSVKLVYKSYVALICA